MHISASKVEDYYNCPFRYFCKFGLRLRPRVVAELNPMNTGTVIHFVLENIVRMYGGKGLSKIGEREMRSSIRNLLDEYLENSMGGEIEKTKRFTYLYGRLTSTVYTVVSHLARELEQSRFEPVDFELRINNDGDVRPLRLRASDGSVISVYGIVDRVDVMKKDGKSYLRVIDYKTGTKVFALDDVFEGLNMQMLIYLFSIWRNGGERYGDIVPSGILYMPAYMPYTNLERHAGADAIRAEADKKLCMNGLVLDDPEVIEGMEQDIGGVFIPVSRKKNEITGSLISLEMLGRLEKKVESLLVQMAESLHSGDIAGKPHEKGQSSACDYCDYRKVCRYPLI